MFDSFFPIPNIAVDHDGGVSKRQWIFLQLMLPALDGIVKLSQMAPTEDDRKEAMNVKWLLATELCEFIDQAEREELERMRQATFSNSAISLTSLPKE